MECVRYAVKFVSLLVLPLLFLVACMDDSPTEFRGDPPRAATIQDALHDDGNPFVFLKPPVVEEPSSAEFGTFNPALQPVVEVCHLDEPNPGDCQILTTNDGSNEDARYTVDGGPGGETVTLDAVAEEYQVQIHFALFDLLENETYRIVTRVGAKQLAFADVEVVSPQEMRNADTGSNIVFTNDQKTVPWKVRIDEGALCWDPGETVISCTSSTVDSGEEETVTLTSSDGEEVDLHLPSGWTATVGGQTQDELTFSIEEVLAAHGTADDPSCFALYSLDDPETGEPSNCYLVRADTDTDTDVTVDFGGSLPILAFCPDGEVLQAIADGSDGWIMTSVEEDDAGAATRTYANVEPASDFGGCPLPPPTVAFGDGIVGSLASALWTHVRPVMTPLLPQPLHAADIGFGGSLDRLSTIFFWSRTPTDLVVEPASPSVAVGQTVQLTVDPVFHEDATSGGAFDVQWSSSNVNVATVDAAGVVTGVADGTSEITATAVNISDPSGAPVTGSATVTVATVLIDGVLSTGEWDNASTFGFAANLPDGQTTPATFFWQVVGDQFYAAVRFERSALDGGNTASIEFGPDPSGESEGVQDIILVNGPDSFVDDVRLQDGTAPRDTDLGGTNDGSGTLANDGTYTIYEMVHPLDSDDDLYDFSLSSGDQITLQLSLRIIDGGVIADSTVPTPALSITIP